MTQPRTDEDRKKRYLGRRRWTPEEDALLAELAGNVGITRIADRLGRTLASVSSHAAAIGISTRRDDYSANEVMVALGLTHYKLLKTWLLSGALEATHVPGRGHRGEWHVEEEALVRFLRGNAHLVDRNKVDVALRQFVDERWITLGEAFRRGCAHVVSLEHAYRCGLLPEARRRGLYIVIPERLLSMLVEGRRRMTSDLEHRRMLQRYERTERVANQRRKAAYDAKQHFEADPIIGRLLEVGRNRDIVDLFEEATG
jgi:hypothetical protein